MSIELIVPTLGESVVEATVATWHKKVGDTVKAGEIVVELETDKVNLDVEAPADGVLIGISHGEGEDVAIGDVLAMIEPSGASPVPSPKSPETAKAATTNGETAKVADPIQNPKSEIQNPVTPVARRMAEAEGVNLAQVQGSGAGGRITKTDVQASLGAPTAVPTNPPPTPAATPALQMARPELLAQPLFTDGRGETREKMSRRRKTIAKRLVEAQHTAAMLTTFNEVDMSAVMGLRTRRKEQFEKATGARLGFMSFFVKASVAALKQFPRLNAEIDGDDMVLKHYYDIGIAVGAEEGLVVPVLRDADRKSFAAIENEIRELGKKARDGALSLEDLLGGTFTITNGGIFGSMLSTPILNAPQVGILGMHNIVERPVAINGAVEIRPIMYVALSYDHRIVDGSEAVQFLFKIKELLEEPERLLLEG
ncbi:MAG: 2-oxoglutarate dehydrogenase complex dihydrolipoyllysine-residue succinyltransferase [Chloroflexi bacterium]|nr:2-oxoglutarate dehydrogenase complex dihydrolipoyllysine-residue succinyltransferase [Chloroflexota bacterium]